VNSRRKQINAAEWLIPTGLLFLSAIPVIAGAARIAQLSGGAEITADNARFFASPLPVIIHIISVTIYSIMGAFQFAPGIRRKYHRLHRATGYVLIPSGLAAAISGLWMSHFYPWPESDGELLYVFRLIFGTAMLLSILLGALAVRRRDYAAHGSWMMRGYAIGLGAGTQVFTHLPWFFLDSPGEFERAMMMAAGWVINLAVAELIIYRRKSKQTRSKRTSSVLASS
jgi:uncharacterized membrane protein